MNGASKQVRPNKTQNDPPTPMELCNTKDNKQDDNRCKAIQTYHTNFSPSFGQ